MLATSIAETSLTIRGVRIVVDSGLSRVPVYEPGLGLTRLVTARASRASVDQRRGRAGRTEPGVCHRLWSEAATSALEPFTRPEILAADLSGLVLDCAAWGVADPNSLAFLDTPPAPALTEARAMLRDLAAIEADGRLTETGKALRALPLPPRLARMLLGAAAGGRAREAADLAAVLVERGLGGDDADVAHRVERFTRDRTPRATDMRRLALGWARQAESFARVAETRAGLDLTEAGALLALAYPDRVARARGRDGEFLMANGRAGRVDAASALARAPFLVVADITGTAAQARILAAAPIALETIEALFAASIQATTQVVFEKAPRALRARALRRLGALTLGERTLPVPADLASAEILARGVAEIGLAALPWTPALAQWRARLAFLRAADPTSWPDLSDASLSDTITTWLAPEIVGRTGLEAITADDLGRALQAPADLGHAGPPGGGGSDSRGGAHRFPHRPRLRGRGRAGAGGARAGTVRPRTTPQHRGGAHPPRPPPALAGLAADPDHPRPAGILARVLERRPLGDARALSASSLARGPRGRAADPPGQAEGDMRVLRAALATLDPRGRLTARAFRHRLVRLLLAFFGLLCAAIWFASLGLRGLAILTIAGILPVALSALAQTNRRLHDRDRSGWWLGLYLLLEGIRHTAPGAGDRDPPRPGDPPRRRPARLFRLVLRRDPAAAGYDGPEPLRPRAARRRRVRSGRAPGREDDGGPRSGSAGRRRAGA